MKKGLFLGVLAALFVCTAAYGQTFVHGSGNKDADALIRSGEGNFHGFAVATDATNACTFSFYDNTTTSGTLLMPTSIVTTSATDRMRVYTFNPPVRFNTGLYVDITCSGTCNYVVYTSR